jgi:hypothetical protein
MLRSLIFSIYRLIPLIFNCPRLVLSGQVPDMRSCRWCVDKGVQRHLVANSRTVRIHRDKFYQRKGLRSQQQEQHHNPLGLPATLPEITEGNGRITITDYEDDDALDGDHVPGGHSEYDSSGPYVDEGIGDDTASKCCLAVFAIPVIYGCANTISVDFHLHLDEEGAYIDMSAWTEKHGVSREAYNELRSILTRHHIVKLPCTRRRLQRFVQMGGYEHK